MEQMIEIIVSLVIALGALALAAWSIISGRAMEQGMDGLFLIIICLLTAVVFGLIPSKAIRQGAFKDSFQSRSKNSGQPEE